MEPYAPVGGADPFAASMELVTALVAELQAAEAAGLTAYELEQFVAGRGREVQRQMVQPSRRLQHQHQHQVILLLEPPASSTMIVPSASGGT